MWQVIELKRGLRPIAGVLALTAMCTSLFFAAVGCGSGGEESTTPSAARGGEASPGQPPAADRQQTASERSGRSPKKNAKNADHKAASPLDPEKTPVAGNGGSESGR